MQDPAAKMPQFTDEGTQSLSLQPQRFPYGDPSAQIIPTYWALKSANLTYIGLFGSLEFMTS